MNALSISLYPSISLFVSLSSCISLSIFSWWSDPKPGPKQDLSKCALRRAACAWGERSLPFRPAPGGLHMGRFLAGFGPGSVQAPIASGNRKQRYPRPCCAGKATSLGQSKGPPRWHALVARRAAPNESPIESLICWTKIRLKVRLFGRKSD